jgi:hypothetical protein
MPQVLLVRLIATAVCIVWDDFRLSAMYHGYDTYVICISHNALLCFLVLTILSVAPFALSVEGGACALQHSTALCLPAVVVSVYGI